MKNGVFQAKEFGIEVGGRVRRCILYFGEEKAERDRKSRKLRLAKARQALDEIATSLAREVAGRKPTRNGIER